MAVIPTLLRGGLVLALVLAPAEILAKTPEELNRETLARLEKDVRFLASAECEGRGVTTRGIDRAADYIAAEFKKIGLRPGFTNSYFQPFRITGAEGTLTLNGPQGQTIRPRQGQHFNPLGYDQDGEAVGPVVFAGYGLTCKVPDYDDYAGLDVTDKVVVVLRDTPRAKGPGRTREMLAGAPFVAKLALAKKKGAVAVLLVNDADTASDGDALLDYSYTTAARGRRHLPAQTVRRSVIEAMLPAGQTLAQIEKGIDRDLKPASVELRGWTARVEVTRRKDMIPLKNVVGVLDGFGGLARETIVVGAHYDHLGYGGPNSLAEGKKQAIHHGADDNASGTTALLELARRYAAMPARQGRRLVFVAFSGEELGLFGSRYYCNNPPYPLADSAAMFNLDMVGRLQKDDKTGLFRLLTEGHGTAKPFKDLIDAQAKKHGFGLVMKASGMGPSDHASFCEKKVPVLFFWTGEHEDYHRPSDTADRINLEGMRRVVDLSEEVVTYLTRMEKPAFIDVPGDATGRPSSDGPRLGIRPGYGGDVEGVEVKSVSPGSPAEKGGIKSGDRIVAIGGNPVKDLGAYMKTLASQKKGSRIKVEVVRNKDKVTLEVNLE